MNGLRREGNGLRAIECECEPRKHRQFDVELHSLQAANAEHRKPELALQVRDLFLHNGAALVKAAELVCVSRDVREACS